GGRVRRHRLVRSGMGRWPNRSDRSCRQPDARRVACARAGAVAVMAHLHLVALVVRDYDPAIRFFVDSLGFELIEDSPALTNDGRAKRWVVVRPADGETGLLLARADDEQAGVIGQQFAGRVGFFL